MPTKVERKTRAREAGKPKGEALSEANICEMGLVSGIGGIDLAPSDFCALGTQFQKIKRAVKGVRGVKTQTLRLREVENNSRC